VCLRLRARGHLVVFTPFAVLYHYESATRGHLHPWEDEALCWKLWGEVIRCGDPYYNPNLTRVREDWSLDLPL
jgi:GT2 family glycosyltransferase